jgi:hypothetical protein
MVARTPSNALTANGKAQASKNAFAQAFNPTAKRVGGRPWKSTEF